MERARVEDVGLDESFEEQQARVMAIINEQNPEATQIPHPQEENPMKPLENPSSTMESPVLPPEEMQERGDILQNVQLLPDMGSNNELLEKSFDKRLTEEEINLLAEEGGRRGVNELFSGDGIALKTELNTLETIRFSQLLFMANRYQIAGIDHFVNNLLQLKVSLNRKGRMEFIQGLHAEEKRMMGQDMSPIQALMSKLGGG